MDLVNAVGGIKYCKKLKDIHLERSLFSREINLGHVTITRPTKYDPPTI